MINKVTLVGNLGKDPEIRRLESGVAVAKLTIATTENYKDKQGNWQEQTEWHNVVLWRDKAERAESYLKKGMMVYVEGKLSTRKWQDKDGKDRWTTDIVASYFRNLGRRQNSDQTMGSVSSAPPAAPTIPATAPATPVTPSAAAPNTPPTADDDELPF